MIYSIILASSLGLVGSGQDFSSGLWVMLGREAGGSVRSTKMELWKTLNCRFVVKTEHQQAMMHFQIFATLFMTPCVIC